MTLALENVTIERSNQEVLKHISLSIDSGVLVGIVGPNGAGKSTLLGALAGDFAAVKGTLRIEDALLSELDERSLAQRRAVMAQQPPAIFNLSVRQVLELGLFAFEHWTGEQRERLLLELANVTGVTDWLDQAMTQRSVGEQQRVHFTRALLQARAARQEGGCAWLLLDEPTANQDPAHQQAMMQACRELLALGSVGVVIVLHDLSLAAQWCDQVIVLKQGAVLTQGPASRVLTRQTLQDTFGQWLGVHVNTVPDGVIIYTQPD